MTTVCMNIMLPIVTYAEVRNLSVKINKIYFVGFEVLTAVVMKSSIFWDITPCSPLKVNRLFGKVVCLHL
jgi:hypothetical protein